MIVQPSLIPPFVEIEQKGSCLGKPAKMYHVLEMRRSSVQLWEKCQSWPETTTVQQVHKQACYFDIQHRLRAATWTLYSPGRERPCPRDLKKHMDLHQVPALQSLRAKLWPKDDTMWDVMCKHGVTAPSLYWKTDPELWKYAHAEPLKYDFDDNKRRRWQG